jgi:hypothetical protein
MVKIQGKITFPGEFLLSCLLQECLSIKREMFPGLNSGKEVPKTKGGACPSNFVAHKSRMRLALMQDKPKVVQVGFIPPWPHIKIFMGYL